MKFRKKPVVIEAVQYPCDHPALKRCSCSTFSDRNGGAACSLCGHDYIETMEGSMICRPGDWIITGIKGEHYPCRDDIFKATYGPVYDEDSSR